MGRRPYEHLFVWIVARGLPLCLLPRRTSKYEVRTGCGCFRGAAGRFPRDTRRECQGCGFLCDDHRLGGRSRLRDIQLALSARPVSVPGGSGKIRTIQLTTSAYGFGVAEGVVLGIDGAVGVPAGVAVSRLERCV